MSSLAAKNRWLALVGFLGTLAVSFTANAADKVGIVLLHGKMGTPQSMQGLADDLTRQGYLVLTPDMPWSKDRAYDRPLREAQQEIDSIMAALRSQGATRLVIGGHSMGANMAISYAAVHPGLDAVMALGPGQTVEADKFAESLGGSIREAKALVAAGKGDTLARFRDIHLGKVSWIETTPSVYLSYFDPEGLANMPALSRAIDVPFLWTVGRQDKNMLDRGPDYAFTLAHKTPLNEYDVVEADHMGTPEASRGVVSQWLGKVFAAGADESRPSR